jgi:hypothetical protein
MFYCPKVGCESYNFLELPYGDNWFLCGDCLTRWILDTETGMWTRDFYGEAEWSKMASYEAINRTYEEVAIVEFEYARSKLSRTKIYVKAK